MAQYTGDVTVEETWEALKSNRHAQLIDVRTGPEWAFVGVCDLSALGKDALLLSWQTFPTMDVNQNFVSGLEAIDKNAPLYFLCRSGVRSQAAAQAGINAGHAQCYNILCGFEGDIDEEHHRGQTGGWKFAGLPWKQ